MGSVSMIKWLLLTLSDSHAKKTKTRLSKARLIKINQVSYQLLIKKIYWVIKTQ